MARATRDARLETRSARDRLEGRHEPYWRLIGPKLFLGYRKGVTGGKWIARFYTGRKYIKHVVGEADDHRDANGASVLDYFAAQGKARAFADSLARQDSGAPVIALSVRDAAREYLAWYAQHRKGLQQVRSSVEAHVIPEFGSRLVSEITTREIRRWHEEMAKARPWRRAKTTSPPRARVLLPADADADTIRRRKITSNRVLGVLRAILNFAWREGHVQTRDAWARVKPYHGVEAARVRYLTADECARFINVCPPDFRDLARGALLTGGRLGELTRLRCMDYNPESRTVQFLVTKTGTARHVPVNEEGARLFDRLTAGRGGKENVFLRADGKPWARNNQARPMADACTAAKIVPAPFYTLRHTYASLLVMGGAPLHVVSNALGHSDMRMTVKHYSHLSASYVADTIRAHLPAFGTDERDNVAIMRR